MAGGVGTPQALHLLVGVHAFRDMQEVRLKGVWGTLCDDDFMWNRAAARVVCRQLGLGGGIVADVAAFGSGTGPIYFQVR